MRPFLLGFLALQLLAGLLIYAPADAAQPTLAQVERSIAYSPVEIACAFSASGVYLGCNRGTKDASFPPGTDAQLHGATILHNQVWPHPPAHEWDGARTALFNGWRTVIVVQGHIVRTLRFDKGSTLPNWDAWARTLTAAWRKHGVWYQADPMHEFNISGSLAAIVASYDEAWQTLAVQFHFIYERGTT